MSLKTALVRFWNEFLVEPLHRVQEEQRAFLARPESRRPDWKVMAVLFTAALVLTAQQYLGGKGDGPERLAAWLRFFGLDGVAETLEGYLDDPINLDINGHIYWALFSFSTYVFIPALVIVLFFRERIRDYGAKVKGAFSSWWVYVVMFCIMAPLLLLVSLDAHFQTTYPFYKIGRDEPLWPNFWTWEMAYGLQFIGLEFFFRGFMVHGTKHRFGVYSIFVMMVPYCMIHYGKPMAETIGAILAGIALGFMSLKTRSIWMGAAIHMSVALSMDFLSMWRKGLLT